jgi:hypothetical protein
MYLEEIRSKFVDWINLAEDWGQLRAVVNTAMNLSI